MPLTGSTPMCQSDFLNLNGINHKIVPSLNYYVAHSDTPFSRLAAARPAQRTTPPTRRCATFTPYYRSSTRPMGHSCKTSPAVRPAGCTPFGGWWDDRHRHAWIRSRWVQADIRGRFQTKRGYPGQQHIVDWMTLDVSGSFFPGRLPRLGWWPYPTQPPALPVSRVRRTYPTPSATTSASRSPSSNTITPGTSAIGPPG